MASIWLRAETKAYEKRTPLTPEGTKILLNQKHKVFVEKSSQRVFSDQFYENVGCQMVKESSWKNAPKNTYILGLKELPDDSFALTHKHIYFAHVLKGQKEGPKILSRFKRGKGTLFDLEYLTDNEDKRVAAFGYWAGFAGAALAVDILCWQNTHKSNHYPSISSFSSKYALVTRLQSHITKAGLKPHQIRALILGAYGRSGRGAVALLRECEVSLDKWGRVDTKKGGPYLKILKYHIFINCVLVQKKIEPFLTKELTLDNKRRLTVIADVSCDPNSNLNPLPLYKKATTFRKPVVHLGKKRKPLDLMAIDHLPSLLPKESSEEYAAELFPHIKNLLNNRDPNKTWQRAAETFLAQRDAN